MTRTLTLVIAGLAIAACTIPPADPLEPAPTISGFSASVNTVTPGATVTLSWLATNAVTLRLDEVVSGREVPLTGEATDADGGVVDAGLPNSVDVTVQATSVFVLTATNARGASTTASVTVATGGTPSDLFFLAAPGVIHSGDTATLVWNTPGTTQVSVTASPGGALPVDQSAAGSIEVTPEFPTAYTLEAGGASRSLVLPVLPTVDSFTAESLGPAPDAGVGDGGVRVHLSWATRGARALRLTVDGRQVAVVTGAGQVAAGTWDDTLVVSDAARVYVYELSAANDAGVELSTASFP
jgi:hypothetical protein